MAQLTELKIKAIKPSEKMARYYDSGGLYLQVSPTGGNIGASSTVSRKRKNWWPWVHGLR